MTTKRADFITELLRTGKIKSWPEHGKELDENPEEVRKWWRQFKDAFVFEGKLTNKVYMTENQIERAYSVGLLTETQAEQLKKSSSTPAPELVESYEDKPSAWDSENRRYLTIEEYCSKYGLDIKTVKKSKLVGHNPNHMVYNIEFFTEERELESFLKAIAVPLVEDVKKHVPNIKDKIPSSYFAGNQHLFVIDIADLHLNKVASLYDTFDEYNLQIAINRAKEAVEYLLHRGKTFGIDRILFIGGNDVLHVESKSNTTTKGTPQDTDKMWHETFLAAKNLYIDLLLKCLQVAPVDFVHNVDNHAYHSSWMLAQVVEAYFSDVDEISFDINMRSRKYYSYFNNLIGSTHGDTSKAKNLNQLMAEEVPDLWAECRRRYWYTHHIHHKVSKDEIGVTVESVRSPSSADTWHTDFGFKGSPLAIEGFIHHRERGQCCRLTYNF